MTLPACDSSRSIDSMLTAGVMVPHLPAKFWAAILGSGSNFANSRQQLLTQLVVDPARLGLRTEYVERVCRLSCVQAQQAAVQRLGLPVAAGELVGQGLECEGSRTRR